MLGATARVVTQHLPGQQGLASSLGHRESTFQLSLYSVCFLSIAYTCFKSQLSQLKFRGLLLGPLDLRSPKKGAATAWLDKVFGER